MKTGRIKDGYGSVQRDIMTDSRIDVYSKAVYGLLVSYAGEKVSCYPSLKTICENLKISKPTVIKSIKQLIGVGFLVADKRKTKLGEHEKNIYYPMYIMDENVVKDVDNVVKDIYQGSKGDLPPVVKEVDTKINNFKINNEDNIIDDVVFETGIKEQKLKKEKGSGEKESSQVEINFKLFWDLYGYKIGIAQSRKAWNKIDLKVQDEILKKTPDWKIYRNQKLELPYPSTFLNNERWNDEINKPKQETFKTAKKMEERVFPDFYDTDFEATLSKFNKLEYENHLRKIGNWIAS